jgi:GTP cyclohydrolase IA
MNRVFRTPVKGGAGVLACRMLMKTDQPMTTQPFPPTVTQGVPVSVKIRERVKAARSAFTPTTTSPSSFSRVSSRKLLDEVTEKMQGVLESMVIDTENDHNTGDTARRVAKMYLKEVFNGRYVKGPAVTEFPNAEHLNELMIVGPITVRSACSHHFCPVIGKIWIGVMPNEHTNVIGLSKYARLAEWIMGRPQIQEEAVVQLADLIQEKTQPDGLAIVMEASHYCMAWRGVKDMDSKMINSVMRGVFLKDPTCGANSSPDSRVNPRRFIKAQHAGSPALCQPRSRQGLRKAIESILESSRSHNMGNGITGVLCYGGGCVPAGHRRWAQGGQHPVQPHRGRQAPHRRGAAALRRNRRTPLRWLDHGQVNLSKLNTSIVLKYSERPEFDPYAVSGKVSLALLEELMATASIIGRA